MRQRGFTLIELIIVVTVICIVAAFAAFDFRGWQARYNVESQIKQTYADLMSARQRATQKNIPYLTLPSPASYTICEDLNANNKCDPAELAAGISTALSKSKLTYAMNWTLAPPVGGAPPANTIVIDHRGLTSPVGTNPTDPTNTSWTATVWLLKSDGVSSWGVSEVDYDCIEISTTRIKLGKYDATKTPVCQAK